MGIEENYAKLTKMLLDNQDKFYRDNEKIDRKYLKEKYNDVVEEPDDDQGVGTAGEAEPASGGEAHPESGTNQPTP